MPTVTKRELVMTAATKTGLTQQQCLDVIANVLDSITTALVAGREVELRNFGVFTVKTRKPRVGRNPHKPEVDIAIPSRKVVKFKPGKVLKAQLNEQAIPQTAPQA